MTPGVRKLALTTHVGSSVGWLGAVAAFLALALTGLGSPDAERVRAACVAMEVIAWFVILPACLTSLASGIIQSLGTPWGLLRHHWTLAKLFITVASTIILLVHMRPISFLGGVASQGTMGPTDLHDVRLQLVTASGGALLALLVATVLSVYKPKGLTWYGRRLQAE
jgi:hypothetical protein